MPTFSLPANLGLVILAGGASRRFRGKQKLLVDLGGRSIGNLLLDDLAPSFPYTYISVRSKEQARILESAGIQVQGTVSFVEDLVEFPGGARDDAAIFGLYSVLLALKEPFALVISGDMPFVSPGAARLLANHLPEDPDAVIPRWENGYIEPTMAIYKVPSAIALIKEMLINRQYQLVDLARGLRRVNYVSIETFKRQDPSLACFVNVNTERDLDDARRWYKESLDKK